MASLTYIEARKEHVETVVVHKHLTVGWCLIYSTRSVSYTPAAHISASQNNTDHIQQLQRQNICGHQSSSVEFSPNPAARSRHFLRTVSTTTEGTPFLVNQEHGAL